MKTEIHSFEYKKYNSISELPEDMQNLMNQAVLARSNAYNPYSKFEVGAAVLLDNGQIVTGNNQENAAYPSGLCAERVAVFYAMSQYPEAKILKIAITGTLKTNPKTSPVTPCGSCRQVILEYEVIKNQSIEILCMGKTGEILVVSSIKDFLPFCFEDFY